MSAETGETAAPELEDATEVTPPVHAVPTAETPPAVEPPAVEPAAAAAPPAEEPAERPMVSVRDVGGDRAQPPRQTGAERQEFARIDAALLEDLLNAAGEISIYHSRLYSAGQSIEFNLEEVEQTVARLREQLRKLEIETEAQIMHGHQDTLVARDFDPLEMDRYSNIQQLSRALAESANDMGSLKDLLQTLTAEAETLLVQQARVTAELQDGLMRTRMVPFQRHVPRLTRLVRQAARRRTSAQNSPSKARRANSTAKCSTRCCRRSSTCCAMRSCTASRPPRIGRLPANRRPDGYDPSAPRRCGDGHRRR